MNYLQKIVKKQKNAKNGVICNFMKKTWQVLASFKTNWFFFKS